MASTTGEAHIVVAPKAMPTQERYGRRDGFALLDRLVCMAGLPLTLEDECAALAVLGQLARREDPGYDRAEAEIFRNNVGRLDSDQVEAILGWLTPSRRWWQWHRVTSSRRCERIRLLFVLAVAVSAHAYRHEALVALVQRGLLGDAQRLQELTEWMRRRSFGITIRRAMRLYLDIIRDAQISWHAEPLGDNRLDEFTAWPWTRQLVLLERRRSAWNLGRGSDQQKGAGPALCADEFEFALAENRMFGKLVCRGGDIAQASLARMGYRDLCPRKRGWPWRILALTAGFLVIAVLAQCFALARVRAWDQQNADLAQLLESSVRAIQNDRAPAGNQP